MTTPNETMIAPSRAQTSGTDKLVIAKLQKTYGNIVALQPTDLLVKTGEFMTLLGPSGSGKTTLLMIVAGLLQSDGGDLWIDGRKATYAPPWERGIGMVFQNYALFPHMTIFENIAFPLRMRRIGEADIRREVGRVLDIVQLPHVADRFPRALSGGQQQRIALARCLVFEPSIILMDEPLGALDKKLREQLQLEIKHLHEKLGTTILYVTHDQGEALTMSDRVCLMNGGRIEQIGVPEDLYFRPASLFAADFLGESNLIDVTVTARNGSTVELACKGASAGTIRAVDASTPPGTRVKMMVRPERVMIRREPVEGCNSLAGALKESIFVGGTTRHYMALEGGELMFGLQLTVPQSESFRPGERVFASWPIDSSVLLAPDAGMPA